MLVYINYPNPHFTIHNNAACLHIRKNKKGGQRIVKINPTSLKTVLSQFKNHAYVFKAKAQWNDLWLDISLSTTDQEMEAVHEIHAILGQQYKPLSSAPISVHC